MVQREKNFDAIIIGTGQGGAPLAKAFAQKGWKTAIIEQKYVGGSCINFGCTPTKTMVASARVAHLVQRAGDYGVNVPSVSVDLKKVRERKRSVVDMFRSGSQKGLEGVENLQLVFGKARFVDSRTVEVISETGETTQLSAPKIFINTGATPRIPKIPGLDQVNFLDSTKIMELDQTPEHLIVVGGGYIGLEFGQMFRRFGSQVTIIQRKDQLLTREDTDVADEVANILQNEGINIHFNSEAKSIEKLSNGQIQLTVGSSDKEFKVTGSHILIATGRVPNTNQLNLDKAGIDFDKRGYVQVNNRLETNVEGIYALGDVKPGPAFTHISYDDSRIIKTNLLEKGNASISGRLVPYTVFIDPQLGRVGLTEKEAKSQNLNYKVAKLPMSSVARAIETDETRGFMKALVDADNGQILGCAILGIEGGEIMSVLQVAMMGKIPYTEIKEGIFAHPLLSESLNNLFFTIG